MNPANAEKRTARLTKVLHTFIRGNRPISSSHDAELFFEAVCVQPSAGVCLETILAQPKGLETVHKSVRASSGAPFITGQVLPFLAYMSHPDIKAMYEGQLLDKIILAVVDPPMTWKAIAELWADTGFVDNEDNAETFARLCLEIVSHSSPQLAPAVVDIKEALAKRSLVKHANSKVRSIGYRVQKALQIRFSDQTVDPESMAVTPGGRHDNDFVDFRDISIYPTTDEFTSMQRPFYRRAAEIARLDVSTRVGGHLENQFRLLREDMLGLLRDDIKVAIGKTKGRRPAQIMNGLELSSINTGDLQRARICAVDVFILGDGLNMLRKMSPKKRKEHLRNTPRLLRHQAFGALCSHDEIVAFAFVVRDVDKLAMDPPVLGLQFSTSQMLMTALAALHKGRDLRFVLVDTPVFAYEPILERLKKIVQLPLEAELLQLKDVHDDEAVLFAEPEDAFAPSSHLSEFLEICHSNSDRGMTIRVEHKDYDLDAAQLHALVYALEKPLSVIQGPPGTGKSYIGALAAKKLLEDPSTRLLVLAYTNHALDQFLEDLINIGVSPSIMTRLGSKSITTTAEFLFNNDVRSRDSWRSKWAQSRLYMLRTELNNVRPGLEAMFGAAKIRPSQSAILEYLKFAEDARSQEFWAAFQVNEDQGDDDSSNDKKFKVVTKKKMQKRLSSLSILDAWTRQKKPESLAYHGRAGSEWIWEIPMEQRGQQMDEWDEAVRAERLEDLRDRIDLFNAMQTEVETLHNEARCTYIRTKRVIGCTTTAAAKYSALLTAAMPTCVLVEEAGEILESHVLTALSGTTRQLILIGDHKQLRPKCANYGLSVEKGGGFDLNRSLFERLILQGHQHVTLCTQHRMSPAISELVRGMTYPELQDGAKTTGRPAVRGLRGRVAFVNHDHAEEVDAALQDRHDGSQPTSRQNRFEALMVLKLVKYLGQQGYKTDDMVVLTPYLGQLRLLLEILSKDNDPMLSDLDSYELIQAGKMTDAASRVDRKKIRISTIDNYQGEEADIVIVSLTRSNSRGEIGFMKAPERLNVLVSRARNCLVMFGNMDTFMGSPQGQDVWRPFFQLLKDGDYLRDGLEVHCEQHPENKALLAEPQDFELRCPDGGCTEPCSDMLQCGLHKCFRRCHRLSDHSMIACTQRIDMTCENQHTYKVLCSEAKGRCKQCERDENDMRRRVKRDLDIEKARLEQQRKYQAELQSIQDEIDHHKRLLRIEQEQKQQAAELDKNKAELDLLVKAKERREAQEKKKKAKAAAAAESKTATAEKESEPAAEPDEPAAPGSAREEWEYLKREELAQSDALDALMKLIGLEDVKRQFLSIKQTVDTASRQGISTASERFGCSMLGNPGTGKTTVARLYAQLLTSMGIVAGTSFKETTGSKMASMGVPGCQKLLDDVLEQGGGVVFIDEAYQLSSGTNSGGAAVLDFLLAEVENLNGKVCFVLAGYAKQMESFFAHNPGFPSRFPHEMKFQDYTDGELLRILVMQANKKYQGRVKAEDGLRGLYCRIAMRRLGSGRGREGFGNARAVENILARIGRRQSERLHQERRAGRKPDFMMLTKHDIIGPEPAGALSTSAAWTRLQGLEGLRSVKESVKTLVDSIQTNYQRELKEEPVLEYSLNRVFLGNPGTGKTTVAKLYGQILVDLGLLSNGEVIVKNPSDFVGSYIGHSEKQTKGILAATAGKVLVIDEAYGLHDGGGGSSGGFKTAVVDTIVAEVQNTPGEDRCVLLLGYKDQMEEMFQNVNPGLSRRFPLSSAFVFEDFNQAELGRILDMKAKHQGFSLAARGRQVALDILDRARNRPNFGNAGEVDILLNDAKMRHQKHLSSGRTHQQTTLDAAAFDEDHDRTTRPETDVAALFRGRVGCDEIVTTLRGYQETARSMKTIGLDPKEVVPFNFLFRGPPGTGKTTTARRMGKVFYDMGFLANASVLDKSASDLIGQYVGQTGPKVRQLLDKALGRVLLIDEAYRLAEGHFAKEALDELVDAVTKERYHKRLIIILAGYEDDINRLLAVNPGLSSRFPEVLEFHPLKAHDCFVLLQTTLAKQKKLLEGAKRNGSLDMACLTDPDAPFKAVVIALFDRLSALASWANARDVETLSKSVFQASVKALSGSSSTAIVLSEATVIAEIETMLHERSSREKQKLVLERPFLPLQGLPIQPPQAAPGSPSAPAASAPASALAQPTPPPPPASPPPAEDKSREQASEATRDAGVSDEVWDQLQRDAAAEREREQEYLAKLKTKDELDKALSNALEMRIIDELMDEDLQKRIAEEERRKKKAEEDEKLRQRIVQELLEAEKKREEEAKIRAKLQRIGRCPMNYAWIPQAGGWRCAGGYHFVTDQQLL